MTEIGGEQKVKTNYIDQEFFEIENGDYSLEERSDLAHLVINEVNIGDYEKKRKFSHEVHVLKPQETTGVEIYSLPSDYASRPNYHDPRYTDIEKLEEPEFTYVIETDEHITMKVPQGTMYVVDLDKNPYLQAYISECSFLAAKTPDNKLIGAHVSYSQKHGTEAVVEFMKARGVNPADIKVVASIGDRQENAVYHPDRASVQDYESFGIPRKNILTFEFLLGDKIDDSSWIDHSFTDVLVSGQFITAFSSDYLCEGGLYGRYTRVSAFRHLPTLPM